MPFPLVGRLGAPCALGGGQVDVEVAEREELWRFCRCGVLEVGEEDDEGDPATPADGVSEHFDARARRRGTHLRHVSTLTQSRHAFSSSSPCMSSLGGETTVSRTLVGKSSARNM